MIIIKLVSVSEKLPKKSNIKLHQGYLVIDFIKNLTVLKNLSYKGLIDFAIFLKETDDEAYYTGRYNSQTDMPEEFISLVNDEFHRYFPQEVSARELLIEQLYQGYNRPKAILEETLENVIPSESLPEKTLDEEKTTNVVFKEQDAPLKTKKSVNKWAIILPIVTLLGIGTMTLVLPMLQPKPNTSISTSITADSLEELLKLKAFDKAMALYPNEKEKIQQAVFNAQDKVLLADFVSKYPSDDGEFDLAFYNKDWDKVISLKTINLSDERKAMLAYAYLQKDNIAEAYAINSVLNSNSLKQAILEVGNKQVIDLLKNHKIEEAKQLNETYQLELSVKIEQVEKIIALIQRYQSQIDTNQSEEAKQNQAMWQKELEKLLQ